jgi:hypothetical protein
MGAGHKAQGARNKVGGIIILTCCALYVCLLSKWKVTYGVESGNSKGKLKADAGNRT